MVINPIVKALIAMGVTQTWSPPSDFWGNLKPQPPCSCICRHRPAKRFADWGLLTLAGALIIGFSLFDMLDGGGASGNMASTFEPCTTPCSTATANSSPWAA